MKPVATRLVEISVLAAIVIGVASAPASADVVRWHMPGVINGSADCPDFGDPNNPDPFCLAQNEYLLQFFPVGTRVDFDLTIDTHDTCSSPDVGVYDIKQFAVTINGVTASSGWGQDNGFLGRNKHAAFECPAIDPGLNYLVAFFEPSGFGTQTEILLDGVEMFLGAEGPGDDLPTVPPASAFYLEPSFNERILGGGTFPGSVVPEPSTLVLVLSGLVTAAARRKRRPDLRSTVDRKRS